MATAPAGSGRLEKVTILAYEAANYAGSPLPERFVAFVNPAEITLAYEIEYDAAQGAGTTGSRQEFNRVKPGDLALAFFIDGTGANGRSADVQAEVERFQTVTGYNGQHHRTNYLKVMWGTLQIRRCVLKSAQITYKLFRPDGVPLRAQINATFADNVDDETRVAIAQDQSPDLTHVRVLAAGDSLPLLCHRIYGDAARCVQVAAANGFDRFRDLAPGTRVVFPPLER
jgi:Contractile injection system tube protein